MNTPSKTMEPQRVLVTGGAGFIGSHLCQRLIQQGHEVLCIDNFDPFYDPAIKQRNLAKLLGHPAFSLSSQDILDTDGLARVFERRPTTVFHLAALAGVRPSLAQPARYQEVNVVGTTHVLEQCRLHGVSRVVFASSSSVYGNRIEVPFRETDRVDDPRSPYAASKIAGELLCHTFHVLYGMDIACLRFFTVYGPRQRPEMAIHLFTRAILEDRPVNLYGDGTSSRDYTYIDDCVDGIMGAFLHLEGYEVFNLGESFSITLDELVSTIETVTGRTAQRRYLPLQPGDVRTTFACIDKARERLGYGPRVSIAEGVRRFVLWLRAEGGFNG